MMIKVEIKWGRIRVGGVVAKDEIVKRVRLMGRLWG